MILYLVWPCGNLNLELLGLTETTSIKNDITGGGCTANLKKELKKLYN